MDGFPDTTCNETAKQRDVGVSDMVVPDPTPAPIPNVVFTEEVLFIDVPLGAVRRRPLSGAPQFRQPEPIIAINHVDIGIKEFLLSDMALIDVGDLKAIQIFYGAGRLRWPQIAAIAEGGRHITVLGRRQPGLKAREGSKGGSPVEPVLGVSEHIDDIALGHPLCEETVNLRKPFRNGVL